MTIYYSAFTISLSDYREGGDNSQVLKWIGIIFGVVIGLLLIGVAAVDGISSYRFNRTYDVQVEAVEIPSDQASIEYDQHVAAIRNCMACHGDDLAC